MLIKALGWLSSTGSKLNVPSYNCRVAHNEQPLQQNSSIKLWLQRISSLLTCRSSRDKEETCAAMSMPWSMRKEEEEEDSDFESLATVATAMSMT